MSKKNSNVILKNAFRDFNDISETYLNFKRKIETLKKSLFVIAVSGGPDSLALVALSSFLKYEKNLKFNYVLIDHNIRKNSYKEALQVKNLLKKHNIKLNILSNKEKINRNIQGNARKIRYDLLVKFCKKKRASIIITAHNLEDQVETFFIRLSRGSGLTGLSAMKPLTNLNENIKLYRPLLDTKKKILIRISNLVFGRFIKDPSNKDTKFLRTKIRNLRKPLKKSGIDYDQIIKSINNLASSKAVLDEYIQSLFKKTIKISGKIVKINLKKFKTFETEVKMKFINESIKRLKKNYYDARSKKVLYLLKNIESKKFKKATLSGCIFFAKNDNLCIKLEKK